jgi:hypothetical protein
MAQTSHPYAEATYRLIPIDDGAFAVEVRPLCCAGLARRCVEALVGTGVEGGTGRQDLAWLCAASHSYWGRGQGHGACLIPPAKKPLRPLSS